jgi:hypothetical protein
LTSALKIKRMDITILIKKIKDFYKGCLDLGDAYKKDERVIDMLGREHTSMHEMTNRYY